jgi:ABC-type transport system involved in cytochrome bd biosynthesis fused ATPase/permease subunit
MHPESLAYIIVGVLFVASFIGFFFFTYVSKVEGEIVESQTEAVVNDLMKGIKIFTTEQQRSRLREELSKVQVDSSEDSEIEKNNTELKKKAIKTFSGLILIGSIILFLLWRTTNFNISEVFQYSLIILALVALTEYLFVSQITRRYELVDSNYIKKVFLDALQKYSVQN